MRLQVILSATLLTACVSPAAITELSLSSADAATSLAVGQSMTMSVSTPADGGDGEDPLVLMQLRHTDGRIMQFEEANHAPHDVMAQAAGGPLAQIMGLFGEETPTLYHARSEASAPFFCGAEGPVSVGVQQTEDGSVLIVGLKRTIEFETRPDGSEEALPYSPDQVCARLRLRRT
jgi:hypothetical protein